MAERENNVYKAKLAEQAERYDGAMTLLLPSEGGQAKISPEETTAIVKGRENIDPMAVFISLIHSFSCFCSSFHLALAYWGSFCDQGSDTHDSGILSVTHLIRTLAQVHAALRDLRID
ncbi:hypothetical protein DMENIID0001_024610 [Sergentomyia squamirostris]